MVGVPGIAARLFSSLSREQINVILITQASSEQSITFALMEKEASRAKEILDVAFEFEIQRGDIEPLKVENNLSIVAIIGENMKSYPGIAGKLFQILGKNGVNVIAIAQGSSELNISCVIKKEDSAKAQNSIHEIFFLSETRQVNIFMVGVG